MDEIIVLTYNVPHRKTYDTLCLLKARGYEQVTVCAKPFHYKKTFQPLIQHRPESNGVSTEKLCDSFGYGYVEWKDELLVFPQRKKMLVCGAGIIPDEMVKKNMIINSHPGYIPEVRGLDALKWAIIEGKKIGCTTHLLGDEIDAGLIIERKEIPIYPYDTFHALAYRVYEQEILMLVDAIEKVDDAREYISGEGFAVHKRMPHEVEINLFAALGERQKEVSVWNSET